MLAGMNNQFIKRNAPAEKENIKVGSRKSQVRSFTK
jgi:hypothetical protein